MSPHFGMGYVTMGCCGGVLGHHERDCEDVPCRACGEVAGEHEPWCQEAELLSVEAASEAAWHREVA